MKKCGENNVVYYSGVEEEIKNEKGYKMLIMIGRVEDFNTKGCLRRRWKNFISMQ